LSVQDNTIAETRRQSIVGAGPTPRRAGAEVPPEADGFYKASDRVSVGGGDENVAKLQLAARWSEQYAPKEGDTLEAALQRFRRVYTYVDSVTKLVDPEIG
jgi:hypothetical protein